MDASQIADLIRAGRLDDARAAADTAIVAGDRSDTVRALAGMIAVRRNDPAAAADHFDRLLEQRPDDRAARVNLAQALIALERFDRIASLCAPLAGDPAVDRMTAYAAQQTGDLATARALYRSIVERSPNDADSWANLGNVHDALGDVDAAIDALERAITARRDEVRFYLNLAGILERADRGEARLRVMRSAAAVRPRDPDVQTALGLAEAALGDFVAAEAALRRAIAIAPDRTAAWLELGVLLENANRIHDLAALVDQARPHVGAELALLEAWVEFRRKDFGAARGHAARLPDTLNLIRRYHLQGEIADRNGDPAGAFACFRAMNDAARAAAPVRTGPTYRETVMLGTEALRAAKPTRRPEAPRDDVPTPVFIVGFPRSGTTLLDTILGRLPDTHILEEQPFIPMIEQRIGDPSGIAALNVAEIAAHRQNYHEARLAAAPEAARRRIVDKHPLHMARMPLIDALFPGAPILFVERHPFDVVLSCFMANFRLNQAMRSFTDLEEAARTFDAVLTAWTEARARLPLRVHTVRYERLVAATEDEIRPALDFIGAGFDPAVLDTVAAAKERGHVRTASYAQVVEPIYHRSVARWERYRDQLAPVRPILAPWAERMGYPC